MAKTKLPTNLIKHTSKNPIQQFLIDNFFSSLVSLIKPLNVESILDAGCGEGFTMNKLKENHIGNKIEGIEYEKDAITFGKKIFPDLTIKQGSIYKLPYKDNSFDLTICTEVLEHLENPSKAVREMLRVSRKYLIISVPNEPFFMISNFLRGKNISRLGNDIGHVNHWSCLNLQTFLEKNGLKIKKLKFPFPWTMVIGTKQ
jgi:2-polyprenyl-3-methyl-5-hydroxy-6-metoxy-1,4-benzoquinol methylase